MFYYLKSYFIYYVILLYNTPNILSSIFFATLFKYSLSLSLSLSLYPTSQKSPPRTPISHHTHNTQTHKPTIANQPPSCQTHHPPHHYGNNSSHHHSNTPPPQQHPATTTMNLQMHRNLQKKSKQNPHN